MPKSESHLARHKRFGFSLTVYPNRIEVKKMSFMLVSRRRIIPLRNIASVERHAMTNRITIETNDGKKHRYITGLQTQAIYEALMDLL